MRFCRFMGFVVTILSKTIIVAIFIISGIALGKAIIETEKNDYWK